MPTFRPSQAALALVAALAAFTCVSCACCRDDGKNRDTAPADSQPTASAKANAGANAATEAATDAYPLIVRLVGRHQTITVTAGPAGPLYSATRSDGTAVVAGATLEKLRRDHPDVYQHLVPSIATERDRDGSPRKPGRDAADTRRQPASDADASLGALMLMSAE